VAGGVTVPGYHPIMSGEKFISNGWSNFAEIPDGGGSYTWWSFMADGVTNTALWLVGGLRDTSSINYHTGFYNPEKDEWTDSISDSVPTLNQGRSYLSGTVASDGYFYAIGGRDQVDIDPNIYDTNERLRVK
jgi:hypothetical protein